MPHTSQSRSVWVLIGLLILSFVLGCRAREAPKVEPVKREFIAPKPSVDPVEEELRRSLKSDEYLVYVDYKFPSFAELEKEFGTGTCVIFDGRPWTKSGVTAPYPEIPGLHVVRAVHVGRPTSYKELVLELNGQGYYPATHLVAYAFQKKYPDLLRDHIYMAFGDAAVWGKRPFVTTIDANATKKFLGCDEFRDIGLFSSSTYLFVRKDTSTAQSSAPSAPTAP